MRSQHEMVKRTPCKHVARDSGPLRPGHAPLAALAVPNPKQRRESPSPASPRMPPGLSWPRLAPSSFGGFGVRRDWILKCVGVEEPENFCTSFFLGFSTCAGHAEVNEASFPSRPCISVGRSSISSTQDGKEDDKLDPKTPALVQLVFLRKWVPFTPRDHNSVSISGSMNLLYCLVSAPFQAIPGIL